MERDDILDARYVQNNNTYPGLMLAEQLQMMATILIKTILVIVHNKTTIALTTETVVDKTSSKTIKTVSNTVTYIKRYQ